MAIGLTEDHAGSPPSLRKWAARRSRPRRSRAAEDEPAAFAPVWKGLTPSSACRHRAGRGPRRRRRHAARPRGGCRGLRPRWCPARCSAPRSRRCRCAASSPRGAVVGIALGRTWSGTRPSATHVLAGRRRRLVGRARGRRRRRRRAAASSSPRFGRVSARPHRRRTVPTSTPRAGPPAAVTLAAAEASGIAHWCLRTAMAYAKVREQFGRPIGSFQAVKHLCAEMLEPAESATAAAWDAAAAASTTTSRRARRRRRGAIALDVAVDTAQDCIQVLGGIGFTWEHDAHLYLRRAMAPARRCSAAADAAAERLADRAPPAYGDGATSTSAGRDEREPRRGRRRRAIAALPAAERQAALVETGLLMPHWPAPYGRGADAVSSWSSTRSSAAGRRAAGARHRRLGGADDPRPRHRRPARAVPAADAARRDHLVPALQRARRRQRPGRAADPGRAHRRRLAAHRPEGVDLGGAEADWGICLARTDPDAPEAPGHHLLPARHDDAGHRHPAAAGADRRGAVQRGLPRRRLRARRLRGGRGRRRLAAGAHHPGQRAGRDGRQHVRRSASSGPSSSPRPALAGRAGAGRAAVACDRSERAGRPLDAALAGRRGARAGVERAKLLGVRSGRTPRSSASSCMATRAGRCRDEGRAGVHEMLVTRCLSIAGGTTQMLRNIAAERILGLPR